MTDNIAKLPISVDLGFVQDSSKPVLSLSLDVFDTHCAEKHKHPRAQLVYSTKGTMKVLLDKAIWVVTPLQAIWVPPMQEHQVVFLQNNHIRNIFLDPTYTACLPQTCFGLDVSMFLKELILRIVQVGNAYELDSPSGRLMTVLLDELAVIVPSKTFLPVSHEPHLKKVIDILLTDPSDPRSLDEFADLACLSPRTFARLFSKEMGLTWGLWKKQVKLMAAVEMLEKGIPITQISYDLGYNSPSAFIEMFRKSYGMPPSKYKDRN